MTWTEFGGSLRAVALGAVVVALFFGLIAGITVGCNAQLKTDAHNQAQREKNKARTEFYRLCQRNLKAGRYAPGCPR